MSRNSLFAVGTVTQAVMHNRMPRELFLDAVRVLASYPNECVILKIRREAKTYHEPVSAGYISEGKYSLWVPHQKISGGSVTYYPVPHKDEIGTIHSHGGMAPFFSMTDLQSIPRGVPSVNAVIGYLKVTLREIECDFQTMAQAAEGAPSHSALLFEGQEKYKDNKIKIPRKKFSDMRARILSGQIDRATHHDISGKSVLRTDEVKLPA